MNAIPMYAMWNGQRCDLMGLAATVMLGLASVNHAIASDVPDIDQAISVFREALSEDYQELLNAIQNRIQELRDDGDAVRSESLEVEFETMKTSGELPKNRLVAREVAHFRSQFDSSMRSLLATHTQAIRAAKKQNQQEQAKVLMDRRRALANVEPVGPSALGFLMGERGGVPVITPDTQFEATVIKTDIVLSGGLTVSDINNNGELVGQYHAEGKHRGFIWRRGAFTEIKTPEAVTSTSVESINDRTEVVGLFRTKDAQFIGYTWRDGDLATFATEHSRRPIAINNSGQVVAGFNSTEIFKMSSKGRLSRDVQVGGTITSINNRGDVVGRVRAVGEFGNHPFPFVAKAKSRWRRSVIMPKGAISGEATWISDTGIVVGTFKKNNGGGEHGFIVIDGEMKVLPELAGHGFLPLCVNSSGVAVGVLGKARNRGIGAIYVNGEIIDLNQRTPEGRNEIRRAFRINEAGQIVVAWGNDYALLTPKTEK